MNKTEKYNKLIDEMSICEKCINIKNKNGMDCSLINIYKNKEFSKNIPSIWTDWYNRLDSNVMIIGQDWGPYNDMNNIIKYGGKMIYLKTFKLSESKNKNTNIYPFNVLSLKSLN